MTPQERNQRMAEDLTRMGIEARPLTGCSGTPYVKADTFTVCWFGRSACYRVFLPDNKKVDVKGSPYHCATQIVELLK